MKVYKITFSCRWNYNLSHTDTPHHVLVTYRSVFTTLQDDQFKWNPYEGVVGQLPLDCREGQAIWGYRGWLICWHIVEPHRVQRVARQFGYVQEILPNELEITPQDHETLHKMTLRGRGNENWLNKLRKYIDVWDNRAGNLLVGQPGIETHPNYMPWYYDNTVIFITNPGRQNPANHMPDMGGRIQNYVSNPIIIVLYCCNIYF